MEVTEVNSPVVESDEAVMSASPQLAVSVVICTWNRSGSLAKCLEALGSQTLSPVAFEIVVVDNNSSDDTAEVVSRFARNSGVQVRYVVEKAQGISAARNRGIAEADGDIIAFTDDDTLPHPKYLENLLSVFTRTGADMVAGKIVNVIPDDIRSDLPRGFLKRMNVSGLDLGPEGRQLRENEYTVGANMAFRKSLLKEIGIFKECLGYVGNCKVPGDDTEFCDRAKRAGASVVWAPDVVVDHCAEAKRYTKAACRHEAQCYGIGRIIRKYGTDLPFTTRCKIVFRALIAALLQGIGYMAVLWSREKRFKLELKMRINFGKISAALHRYKKVS